MTRANRGNGVSGGGFSEKEERMEVPVFLDYKQTPLFPPFRCLIQGVYQIGEV
jgi:hypothetical protein